MTQQRPEAEKDDTLHAEAERLRKAMESLAGELNGVVADLRDLLAKIPGSEDHG